MRLVLLGTAAGGGFPQWDCACALCARAGEPGVPARSQDGLAVSADGTDWYLLNASPDLRVQVLATPALHPGPGPRDTPIRGVLLTDGELDHTLGLAILRGAPGLRVWAPGPVADAFPLRTVIDGYGEWDWRGVDAPVELGGGLEVTAAVISGKRPRYAASAPAGGWVVAYRIHDPATGGTVVYAPCLAEWPAALDGLLDGADVVLLDGTFWTADELPGAAGRAAAPGPGASTPMGHLPVDGPAGSLARIRERPGPRWVYTHLNNTNPLLDAGSTPRKQLAAAGATVLDDGTELRI